MIDSIVYTYHILFEHLPTVEYLGYFYLWAITNSALVNLSRHLSSCFSILLSLNLELELGSRTVLLSF